MIDYFELIKAEPERFRNSDEKQSLKIVTDAETIKKAEAELYKEIGVVYEDEYIRLLRDLVTFPDGRLGTYVRLMNASKDGCICVVVREGKILFVEHYRHALRRFSLELPRGFGEEGFSAEENAKKELIEECGIAVEECKSIGRISADSGILSSEPWVVIAHAKDSKVSFNDAAEPIKEALWLTPDEIDRATAEGRLNDGLSLAAIALARAKREVN